MNEQEVEKKTDDECALERINKNKKVTHLSDVLVDKVPVVDTRDNQGHPFAPKKDA